MTNYQSFPLLINGIIKEFTSGSEIYVVLSIKDKISTDPDRQEFKIVSVNGFKCLTKFTLSLEHLAGVIEDTTMEYLNTLEPADKPFFLSELNRQLKTLPDLFIKQDFIDLYRHLIRKKERFFLKFNHLHLRNKSDQEITPESFETIENMLVPYAQAWCREIGRASCRERVQISVVAEIGRAHV